MFVFKYFYIVSPQRVNYS